MQSQEVQSGEIWLIEEKGKLRPALIRNDSVCIDVTFLDEFAGSLTFGGHAEFLSSATYLYPSLHEFLLVERNRPSRRRILSFFRRTQGVTTLDSIYARASACFPFLQVEDALDRYWADCAEQERQDAADGVGCTMDDGYVT